MSEIQKIVNRMIAGPFFRQHAGVFLFLFFILFGIQPSFYDALKTHYAIIMGILTSANFFLVALCCWILYAIKCLAFFRSCLQKGYFDFLYELNALDSRKRFGVLLQLHLLLLSPVIAYGIVILLAGIKNNLLVNGLFVFACILLLVLSATAASYFLLNKAKALQQVTGNNFLSRLPPSLFGFMLRFIFLRQFFSLVILKILSFGCLYFFARTEASVFEERMLWLLFITSLAGHSMIVYKNFHFMETELGFYRNLPVKKINILLSLLILYVVLLIPETWALRGIINQVNATEYLWMVLTGPSLLLLLHSLLYTEDMNMEEYLKLLFGVWVVFIFFSLSRNHWILPAIAFTFSVIIFWMSYYKYEKNAAIEGLE